MSQHQTADLAGLTPQRRAPMDPSPTPRESADTSLRQAVLARLFADPLVSSGHIAVAADSGHVTLAGYVTSDRQKYAARAATRRVKGVEEVVDEVVVAVPCPVWAELRSEDLEAPSSISK